jgi:Porin subfamily
MDSLPSLIINLEADIMQFDPKAASKVSFTAAGVLLVGAAMAHADELADLRASQAALIAQQTALDKEQEVLKARIDQLAQGPNPGSNPGATGTATPSAPTGGGSFARSFLIPGTETSIRVGGFVDESVYYYLQNGPANGVPSVTAEIDGNLETMPLHLGGGRVPGYPTAGNLVPVNVQSSRGNGVFFESPQKTRLNVETQTPTEYGNARTFLEIDFKGTNNFSTTGENGQSSVNNPLIPRMRYAFGTLGGFLAGQANSNFRDAAAEPETFADDGPPGIAGPQRIPQVRYTYQWPLGIAWTVAAEMPSTEILTPAGKIASDSTNQVINTTAGLVPASNGGTGTCVANGLAVTNAAGCTLASDPTKASAPDLTFSSYWAQPWGHVNFRGVLRPTLTINDGRYVNQQFVGYGGGLSGDVKPGWGKDDFQWQFTIGNAIGRYLTNATSGDLATNYLVTPASPAAAANVLVKPIMMVGGVAGYQHWWLSNLRSNIDYGYWQADVSSQLVGPVESTVANKRLQAVNFNVIWNPVAFIDTGIEYLWGKRTVIANFSGQEQLLIGEFRVKF